MMQYWVSVQSGTRPPSAVQRVPRAFASTEGNAETCAATRTATWPCMKFAKHLRFESL